MGKPILRTIAKGLKSLWPNLSRPSGRLFDLNEIESAVIVHRRRYAGVHTVPLDQIRGSEGRCEDFDASFKLRRPRLRLRWLNVAHTMRRGHVPPVELIKIGDIYFVRDGHHRISVARWLGWKEIEAVVTIWDVTGKLPWER